MNWFKRKREKEAAEINARFTAELQRDYLERMELQRAALKRERIERLVDSAWDGVPIKPPSPIYMHPGGRIEVISL